MTPEELKLLAKLVVDELEERKRIEGAESQEDKPAPDWARQLVADHLRRKGPPKRRRAA